MVASGQKSVVANAVEAIGNNVHQKAANELVWFEVHDPLAAAAAISLCS
jgi:hypothetical protein